MAVVETVYDSACKVCDIVRYQLYRAYIYVQRSKQLSANERIFLEIRDVDKDAGYHLANMNDKTNQHYEIELSKTKRITWAWDMKNDIDD